ncbi:sugar 3,4-ketoisomerase [Microbacterium sp. P5_E9]
MSLVDRLDRHSDARGHLVAVTAGENVPFEIRRVFWIFGNTAGLPRAGHASSRTTELLISVAGSCRATLDGPTGVHAVTLDRPDHSLLVPPLTWLELSEFTVDCVLLVLADTEYAADHTITSLDSLRAGRA